MLCRWSAFSCVSSECEPPSPLLQSRKERSGFLKSRLLIFGMPWKDLFCNGVQNSCGLLTPSQVWLLREGAKKEKLCRESQSRRNQAFKPNWLAASTDALALKTLPFALNECLRLTTLLLSSQQKKKNKSPETGDSEVGDESISRCHSAAPHQLLTMCSRQSASVLVPDGKKTWMNLRRQCTHCSKAPRKTRWKGSVAHRLRSILLV